MDHSKRALFRGKPKADPPIRPPWSVPENEFTASCTRCGECVRACPEAIIINTDGGYPQVDFSRGECTFCQACLEACPESCFHAPDDHAPWSINARIAEHCLSLQSVYCRSCGDACPTSAIKFAPRPGGKADVTVIDDSCTGCGACLSVCPVNAVSMQRT